jgi:pSer/pThr/pTyr-binding forkhead associated (FHA) protein
MSEQTTDNPASEFFLLFFLSVFKNKPKMQASDSHPDFPDINYSPPTTASSPPTGTSLNIIKNGQIQTKLSPSQSHSTIGRLPTSDIHQEHPSISRTHAILQFTDSGASLFDLGSTHGTFVNRERIQARTHVSLKSNDVIRYV